MRNKVLIELLVPEIEEKYSIFIPINKRIGNIIVLLNKAVNELTNNQYIGTNTTCLYNQTTGERYSINSLVRETDIRNGCTLILL